VTIGMSPDIEALNCNLSNDSMASCGSATGRKPSLEVLLLLQWMTSKRPGLWHQWNTHCKIKHCHSSFCLHVWAEAIGHHCWVTSCFALAKCRWLKQFCGSSMYHLLQSSTDSLNMFSHHWSDCWCIPGSWKKWRKAARRITFSVMHHQIQFPCSRRDFSEIPLPFLRKSNVHGLPLRPEVQSVGPEKFGLPQRGSKLKDCVQDGATHLCIGEAAVFCNIPWLFQTLSDIFFQWPLWEQRQLLKRIVWRGITSWPQLLAPNLVFLIHDQQHHQGMGFSSLLSLHPIVYTTLSLSFSSQHTPILPQTFFVLCWWGALQVKILPSLVYQRNLPGWASGLLWSKIDI